MKHDARVLPGGGCSLAEHVNLMMKMKMLGRRLRSAVIMGIALVLEGCGGGVNTTPVTGSPSSLDTAFSVVGRSIYEATVPLVSLVPASTARTTAAVLPNRLFLRGLNYSPQPNGVDISVRCRDGTVRSPAARTTSHGMASTAPSPARPTS
jgi:hypothetical protein